MEPLLSPSVKKVLITGGAGFIGGRLVEKLLRETKAIVYNFDKIGYASNHNRIDHTLALLEKQEASRYHHLRYDLANPQEVCNALELSDPDLVMHLAAESHVDRSIVNPEIFINSNITGTFNLLQAVLQHWCSLSNERKECFRFLHVSTDEVFGSLGDSGSFNEHSHYQPQSPYSASKAASDHLVRAWHNTYQLPTLITNCSNNYGPWQYHEKLIPQIITRALKNMPIRLYGDGSNVRDWLYVDDHVEALLLVAQHARVGETYCIGGSTEISNYNMSLQICDILDTLSPLTRPHSSLISFVEDRPGHDKRYSIDASKIKGDLGWFPKHKFRESILKTVQWYLQGYTENHNNL